jgi:ABC-type antimicrobial peptide transport system permease subunit
LDGLRIEGVIEHQHDGPEAGSSASQFRTFKYIVPGWFQTMGTPLVAGRDLTWTDVHDLTPVALISENLARELWGSPASAVGQSIRPIDDPDPTSWREVVGVVADVHEYGLRESAPAIVYWVSSFSSYMRYAVRTPLAGSSSLLADLEQAVRSVSSGLPITAVRTMQDVYDQSMQRTSLVLLMLIVAAAIALLLGIFGLYGTLAYILVQQRREIAIRLALGARAQLVVRQYVGLGLALTTIGIVIGIAAAAAGTRLISSLLYGVSSLDPLTFVVVSIGLLGMAGLACYLPARRALNVAPAEVLAGE